MTLFDFLKIALNEREWSIPYFARRCGVSVQLAYKWLAEDPRYRVKPSPASCGKIADALGLDPDYMLGLAGHRQPRPEDLLADPEEAELLALIRQVAVPERQTVKRMLLGLIRPNESYGALIAVASYAA